MLTLESKFSEYEDMLIVRGACGDAVNVNRDLAKANEDKTTIADAMVAYRANGGKYADMYAACAFQQIGKEMDDKLRTEYLGLITTPSVALKLLQECSFLIEKEKTLLKGIYSEKLTAVEIKDPMEAARLYIDCAPVLTETESLSLKAIFEGKLPTVEKELRDGIVTRATAEVKP